MVLIPLSPAEPILVVAALSHSQRVAGCFAEIRRSFANAMWHTSRADVRGASTIVLLELRAKSQRPNNAAKVGQRFVMVEP